MDLVSVAEAARRLGYHRVSVWSWCRRHPSLALNVAGRLLLPAQHVERLRAGESPAQVAGRPSVTAIGEVAA